MKVLTICFGILLILLGASFVYVTDTSDFLTFMPFLIGIVITIFGVLQGKWPHKHALYASLLLAFLAFLSSLRALSNLLTMLSQAEVIEPNAVIVRSIIGISSVVFIGLGLIFIKDFWSGWQAFGHFMGDMLARVVLTIFYFTIFVPFGLGVRLFADPLYIKTHPNELWRSRFTGDQTLEELRRQF